MYSILASAIFLNQKNMVNSDTLPHNNTHHVIILATKPQKLHQKTFINDSITELKLTNYQWSSEEQQAKVLDTLIDFTDYKFSKEIFLEPKNESISNFKREILIARSKVSYVNNDFNLQKKIKKGLNFAHPPRIFGLGKTTGDEEKYNLYHRSALHNILDLGSNF